MAREYALALPAELDAGNAVTQVWVWVFAEDTRDRYGVTFDIAIHGAHDIGDDRSHHAHVKTTTRVLGAKGLGQ